MERIITKKKCSKIAIFIILLYSMVLIFVVYPARLPAAFSPAAPGKHGSFSETKGLYHMRVPMYANSLAQQFLVPQNEARAQVGETPLVWDERVAAYAQWYAEQRRGDCALRHSLGPYGENLFRGSGKNWQPYDAAVAWLSEKRYYDSRKNSCIRDEMCGHYTQIVWKNTRKIGCARVVCHNGQIFMTCNYFPPGYYVGEKPY